MISEQSVAVRAKPLGPDAGSGNVSGLVYVLTLTDQPKTNRERDDHDASTAPRRTASSYEYEYLAVRSAYELTTVLVRTYTGVAAMGVHSCTHSLVRTHVRTVTVSNSVFPHPQNDRVTSSGFYEYSHSYSVRSSPHHYSLIPSRTARVCLTACAVR